MSFFFNKKPWHKEELLNKLKSDQINKEFSVECDCAELKVDDMQLLFKDGAWIAELCDGMSSSAIESMKRRNEFLSDQNAHLLDQNNMLKLKIAILLDMLSETTAESHILEKERDDAIFYTKKKSRFSKA